MGNIPYKKQYVDGILINPITKENPYIQNSGRKGEKKFRNKSNTQGHSMIVLKIGVLSFEKYKKIFQLVKGKLIPHLQLIK